MRNTLLSVLTVVGFTLFAFASFSCSKAGSSGQQQTQVNNMNTDCVNYPQNCNNGYYNNNYGFQPYNYTNGGYFANNGYYGTGSGANYYNANGSGLCNCPQGTMPTYNSYAGMGCVNSSLMGNSGLSGYAYFSWGTGTYGANNNQWTNIPQVSNYAGYGSQSCYNGVVQSCLTDQQNMCSSGYTCRASSAESRLGLCVSNSSASAGQIFR